jgi:aminoethylphosphonate catabolism LysR family transcriptional regulator
MRSTQLRSFHAVASAGGFVAAAERLSVSQPTLTMQIAALEREFDVELFHRRNRRSELTTAGRDLFAITTRLFAEEQEAREFLNSSKGLRTGHLRVGAVGPYHVTEMLAAFGARYPGIRISVSIGNSLDVQQALLNYETEVAVLAHIDPDDRLFTIPYSRHPVLVFTNGSHHFAAKPEISLRELEGERVIAREMGSTTRRALEAALREQNVSVDNSIEIGSREAIREAVIRGLGIGYVSEAEFVPDPALHAIRIADAEIVTVAQLVVLRERRTSRLIRAFTDVVASIVRDA